MEHGSSLCSPCCPWHPLCTPLSALPPSAPSLTPYATRLSQGLSLLGRVCIYRARWRLNGLASQPPRQRGLIPGYMGAEGYFWHPQIPAQIHKKFCPEASEFQWVVVFSLPPLLPSREAWHFLKMLRVVTNGKVL